MSRQARYLLIVAGILASFGASYPTPNFVVEAPTAQLAEQVGKWAEYYRKEKAMQWIGKEMATWPERCPIKVKVTAGGAGGATSFNFTRGMVWQSMTIEGPVERIIYSVLPHEVTHTVFAHYFRSPVPRWADEGGAVLSEDDLERGRHDTIARQLLNAGRAMPLGRLFNLHDYPSDPREIGTLYAEGYSVVDYLVSLHGRKAFLDFVGHGMQYDWDSAAKTHYQLPNVGKLQEAWIESLRTHKPGRAQSNAELTSNAGSTSAEPAKRVVVRLTAPPSQPFVEPAQPVVRAQSAEGDPPGGWYQQPRRQQQVGRPDYLPPSDGGKLQGNGTGQWQPASLPRAEAAPTPSVRLGDPQFIPSPTPATGRSGPGYPR